MSDTPKLVHWDDSRYRGKGTPKVKYLLWHCTAGASAQSSREWLNRRNEDGTDLPPAKRASYSYIIDHDGTIYRHTPLTHIANHAGKSQYPVPASGVQAGKSMNGTSLGIAFANMNDGTPLTAAQLKSARWLAATLMKRFSVPASHNLGHLEVAPGRKTDPRPDTLNMDYWRNECAKLVRDGYTG